MPRYGFVCLPILFLFLSAGAQCPEGLAAHSRALPQGVPTDFGFLSEQLEDVQLVGYGEMTHGTAEATQGAERLFMYLVQERDFQCLIIEAQVGEVTYFNDYVQGRTNDAAAVLEAHNSSWRYNTQEFVALLNALRDYNAQHDHKVSIHGCEMQYVAKDVQRLNDYFERVGNAHRLEGFDKMIWQAISDEEQLAYTQTYYATKHLLDTEKETLVAQSDERQYWEAYHHLEVLFQFLTVVGQPVEQRKHDLRDWYMAQNIQWIHQFYGGDAVYWAHNAHVGDWISNGIVDVAGHHLKKAYGDRYFNLNVQLGRGRYRAFPHNANDVGWTMQVYDFEPIAEGSFTACLRDWGQPNAFVALRAAHQDAELSLDWEQPWTVQASAGAQHFGQATETIGLGRAFDGILYLHQSSPITWLD